MNSGLISDFLCLQRMDEIVKKFFLWLPIDLIWLDNLLQQRLVTDTDLQAFQFELLARTLKSDTFAKFPTHFESSQLFFKKFVTAFENLNIESIFDEFYEASVPMRTENQSGNLYYKSYLDVIGQAHLCSLIEKKEFVSQGTTGLQTWPAAEFLFEHLMQRDFSSPKVVLELGSGIGYLGISCLKHIKSFSKWIFTDHSDAVLQILNENIAVNGVEENKYHLQNLDWMEEICYEGSDHDLIVASDVVFDQRIIPNLVQVLKQLMTSGKSAIIANVERNEDTKVAFESNLTQNGLEFRLHKNNNMLLYDIEMHRSS